MTFAVFTPQGHPLYWTYAETAERAWLKFVSPWSPCYQTKMREAFESGYTAKPLAALQEDRRILQYREADARRVAVCLDEKEGL